MSLNRELVPQTENVLGLNGIEFVEYATSRPQALGQVLEQMGFAPVARHRSREVILYRQGTMNLIINAHPDDARVSAHATGEEGSPILSSVAFRVRDARLAHARSLNLGAWDVPFHAQAMELNIPGIHGPGQSRFYFVDRQERFSIYDIDFDYIPSVEREPKPIADLSFFGIVQYIGEERTDDWCTFYSEFFGFSRIPDEQRYGVLPRGSLMRSPCGQFLWQLVEPVLDDDWSAGTKGNEGEKLQRIGLGTANVASSVDLLRSRGIEFVEVGHLIPEARGAITRNLLGSVAFELVRQVKS